MNDLAYEKPLPEPSAVSRPFWEALREHRLVLQCCRQCHTVRHYPRPVCDRCYSMDYEWLPASGRGTLHSWSTYHHPFHFAFKRDMPYVVLTVDLEEGVRLQAPLRGADASALKLGAAVEVVYEDATDEVTLPAFRLVATTG
ncbi:MAG: Zn-ribbon domain-containing OB-fold protein [Gammaproteobacteria bacterium]